MEDTPSDPEEIALRRCWGSQPELKQVMNEELSNHIEFLAKKKGFPEMFLVANIMVSTLHFTGKSKVVVIDSDNREMKWSEPHLINAIVIAGCGTNKSGATKDVLAAAKMAEKIMQEKQQKKKVSKNIQIGITEATEARECQDNDENVEEEESSSSQPPKKKLKVDVNQNEESEKHISVLLGVTPEKLKEQLCAGVGDIILINEELSGFLQTIQSHRTSSGSYKDDFGNYFGASEIRSSTCKGGTLQQKDPRLNVIGYIQPIPLLEIMEKKENVGFWHRWLFLCPKRVIRRFKVMRELPMPPGPQLDLKQLLMRIFFAHMKQREYSMTQLAQDKLDEIEEKYQLPSEKNPTSSELSGKASKGLTQIIRLASANACLRNSLKALKNEKNLPMANRFSELSEDATFEKRQECAELGMEFLIEVEDLENAYTLVKFSDVCYETFRDVSSETENNSPRTNKSNKGLKREPVPTKTLDSPENETSDYIFRNKNFIVKLYKEVDPDLTGKCKFSSMSTKKIFPNVSVKGKSASEKMKYFAEVLLRFEIIKKVDSALFKKMEPEDWENLSEDGKKVWSHLYKLTKGDEALDPFEKGADFDIDTEDTNTD